MFPIIDFRNGRYQGQTKNHLPHGIGFFIDKNYMLVISEWLAGDIKGYSIIIYPSGRIFCGKIGYKRIEQLCSFQLTQDHVQLISVASVRNENDIQKIAAILPLLKIILQIDNSNPQKAIVLKQYDYSFSKEDQNLNTISQILNLDRSGPKTLHSYKNCIQFFQDYFLKIYPQIFQFMITDNKGKKEYFIGLKGQGLGVKIQPRQQLVLNMKKTQMVYLIRGMGYFTKQNQLKNLGFKTHDNVMKGIVYEQGIYSMPQTIIKYENGKRPINCCINFHNFIKRSLFYRDKVLDTEYIYQIQNLVFAFNENMRKIETEKLAQFTIQNPNKSGETLVQIQRKRREKQKENQIFHQPKETLNETLNPYNPASIKLASPQFNLLRAKDQIYRTASKKKNTPISAIKDYKNSEYIDPNFRRVDNKDYNFVPTRQPQYNKRYDIPQQLSLKRRLALQSTNRPISPFNNISRSPHHNENSFDVLYQPRGKRTYQPKYEQKRYQQPLLYDPRAARKSPYREQPKRYNYEDYLNDQNQYRSPPPKSSSYYPQSEEPKHKSYLQHDRNYPNLDRSSDHRPRYNYHFDEYEPQPQKSTLSPIDRDTRRRVMTDYRYQ